MLARRPFDPALGALVQTMWTSEGRGGAGALDRTLPTGCVHVVFRLSDEPLRVADDEGAAFVSVGRDVVGGPRITAYLRARSRGTTVGVQLHAGAARAVLGVPADSLRGRHHALEDVVGRRFGALRERLLEAPSAEARLEQLEATLAGRARDAAEGHPSVALALAAFRRPELPAIGALARAAGLSPRRFVTLFQRAVGLAPSEYRRVLRVQRSLDAVARGAMPLAAVAAAYGFADQAHLTREYRAITGITPGAYRAARSAERDGRDHDDASASLHHVSVTPRVPIRSRRARSGGSE
jgi:AraC-like DNA-binding protein